MVIDLIICALQGKLSQQECLSKASITNLLQSSFPVITSSSSFLPLIFDHVWLIQLGFGTQT